MDNPFLQLFNKIIDWIAVLVIPAGIIGMIITSVIQAVVGEEFKPKAKKTYVWILIAVFVGLGAKGIMIVWEGLIKGSGF